MDLTFHMHTGIILNFIPLHSKETQSIFVFDVEEGGPSLNAAIPGVDFPLGLCLTEAPDLMGAMTPCPRKSSVCPDH